MARRKDRGDGFSFDFSSLDFDKRTEEQARPVPRYTSQTATFENAEDLVNALDYEKDYFLSLSGAFVFGDFLESLVYQKELAPSKMYITSLGMSQDNIDSLVNIVDFLGCQELNLLVSHYFAGVERHGLIPYMEREFSGLPINVAVLQSHCKIALIRSQKGDCIITGSANLSSSNNVEQIVIQHDPHVLDYVEKKLINIFRRFIVYNGMDRPKWNWKKNKGNTGRNAWEATKDGGE